MSLPGFGSARPDPGSTARVRAWVRDTMASDDERSIVVAELACHEPGCPPVETVIGLLAPGNQSHYKIHKPLTDVVAADVARAMRLDDLHEQAGPLGSPPYVPTSPSERLVRRVAGGDRDSSPKPRPI